MLDLTNAAVDTTTFADVAEALSLGLPYRVLVSADGRDARFVHVGAACQQMLGVSAEALMADPAAFVRFVPDEDRLQLLAAAAAAFANGRVGSVELRIVIPGSEPRWRRVTAAARPRPDGSREWEGLMVDITEAKRLSEQRQVERWRLEQAIEVAGLGVYHWNRDDRDAVDCSDRVREIYGFAREHPVTVEMFARSVHPEDKALVREGARGAIQAPEGLDWSFEHRIVRPDGDVRWVQQHQRVHRDRHGLKTLHGAALDITERRNAEEQRRLQMRELAHRNKNALGVLSAMVHQAARGAHSVDDLARVLMARIGAMSRSQDLATAAEGAPLPLLTLARQALDVFDLARFDFDPGLETLTVPGDSVVALGLMFHELGTNALKYGSFSTTAGRVSLTLGPASKGRGAFEWREAGGPAVAPPTRQGFGMRLLAAVLQGAGGRVEPAFEPEGFRARIEITAPEMAE